MKVKANVRERCVKLSDNDRLFANRRALIDAMVDEVVGSQDGDVTSEGGWSLLASQITEMAMMCAARVD